MGHRFEAPGHFCHGATPSEDELILEARALLARRYAWRRLADQALRVLARVTRQTREDAARSVSLALWEFDAAQNHPTLTFQLPMGLLLGTVAA